MATKKVAKKATKKAVKKVAKKVARKPAKKLELLPLVVGGVYRTRGGDVATVIYEKKRDDLYPFAVSIDDGSVEVVETVCTQGRYYRGADGGSDLVERIK